MSPYNLGAGVLATSAFFLVPILFDIMQIGNPLSILGLPLNLVIIFYLKMIGFSDFEGYQKFAVDFLLP